MSSRLFVNGRDTGVMVEVADTFISRFCGLMFRKRLPPNAALALIPCDSIHCAFMRFPIDAAFVDSRGTVLSVRENIIPFWLAIGPKGTRWTLEMSGGVFRDIGITADSRLELKE